MKTQQWTVAALAAALVAFGGAGLAAAGSHASGTILIAANGENYTAGVGGNGAAGVRQGETYGGVGGNGAAAVRQGETYGGVGGNGAAAVRQGETYGGVGGNGSATVKQQ
jgi:hypothetical protein